MDTYDFSTVDFSRPEVRASLAKAYAVVLRIAKPPAQENHQEANDTGKENHAQQKAEEAAKQATKYVQERLF